MMSDGNHEAKGLAAARVLLAVLALVASACGRSALDDSGGSGGATGVGAPTGLLPATPGLFLCGTQTCLTASQQCCLGTTQAGGLGATCGRLGESCGGAAFQCDEPADCRGPTSAAAPVCCFGLESSSAIQANGQGLSVGSRCGTAAACAGLGRFTLCATDSDCRAAGGGAKGDVCCASVGIPACQPRCPGL